MRETSQLGRYTSDIGQPLWRKGKGTHRMIDKRLEHFLLYDLSDDWMPVGAFVSFIRQISPATYSRTAVLDVIAELAAKGYLEYGGWSRESGTWEPWKVPADVAVKRIANGFDGEPGVLDASGRELPDTEVFRAGITAAGKSRIEALGNPFEIYGDPWDKDPSMRAEGSFPPWCPDPYMTFQPNLCRTPVS